MSSIIVKKPGKLLFHTDPLAWFTGFREFLHNFLLTYFLSSQSDTEIIEKILTKKNLEIIAASITDETYEPIISNHLEIFEFHGDEILSSSLSYYIIKEKPEISEDIATNIGKKYMSEKQQIKWAEEMNLTDWFRGLIEIKPKKKEDLFEAIIGGIHIAANIVVPGLGDNLCRNFIYNLFKDIDITETKKDAKTSVKDIFETSGWSEFKNYNSSDYIKMKDLENKKTRVKFYLTEKAFNVLKGPTVKDNLFIDIIIGNSTKQEVELFVLEKVLEKLENLNFTRESILEKRRTNIVITDELTEKLQHENLHDPIFKHFKKTNYYQLLARRKNEDLEILAFAQLDFDQKLTGLTEKKISEILVNMYLNEDKFEETKNEKEKIIKYNSRVIPRTIKFSIK